MSAWTLTVVVAYAVVIASAWLGRSRTFAVFAAIILGFPILVGPSLRAAFPGLAPVILALQLAACMHVVLLMFKPTMRPWWWRASVSLPALWFVSASFLALPWGIAGAFGWTLPGVWVPFALAGFGLLQSLYTKDEIVDVVLDNDRVVDGLRRYPEGRLAPSASERPVLHVMQIADPHLGPFMSVERLRGICNRIVERRPDLVLITGDMMTMESHDLATVRAALAPLGELRGRVFACLGNHDHEALHVLRTAYAELDIVLLVDAAAIAETSVGPVQIVGADFVWRDRAAHLRRLDAAHPRPPGVPRILLLHDPGAFRHLPEGAFDLVLSGHTHGGQLGLLSLGLRGTFLSAVSSMPDHGLWARGRDRLYVHRAQGHYGFPIRLGVPAEQSLLRIHLPA